MNIGPFATTEEAIEWGNKFAAAIEKGVDMFTAQETEQRAAITEVIPDSFSQNDYVISQIEEIAAVIATTRRTLSALIPELRLLIDVDHKHIQPVTAAVFMLDSVEHKLDEINLFLMPVGEIHKAMHKMAVANKTNLKKK